MINTFTTSMPIVFQHQFQRNMLILPVPRSVGHQLTFTEQLSYIQMHMIYFLIFLDVWHYSDNQSCLDCSVNLRPHYLFFPTVYFSVKSFLNINQYFQSSYKMIYIPKGTRSFKN